MINPLEVENAQIRTAIVFRDKIEGEGRRRELHFTPPLTLALVFAQESRLGAIEFHHFCCRFPPQLRLQFHFNHRNREEAPLTISTDSQLVVCPPKSQLRRSSFSCLPFVDGRLLTGRIRIDAGNVGSRLPRCNDRFDRQCEPLDFELIKT